MYPPTRNSSTHTVSAVVTLPDGRRVRASEEGYTEGDTGAWVEKSDMTITDLETDDELSDDECNVEFEVDGKKYTVVEYVSAFGQWEHDF